MDCLEMPSINYLFNAFSLNAGSLDTCAMCAAPKRHCYSLIFAFLFKIQTEQMRRGERESGDGERKKMLTVFK